MTLAKIAAVCIQQAIYYLGQFIETVRVQPAVTVYDRPSNTAEELRIDNARYDILCEALAHLRQAAIFLRAATTPPKR